jgi:hypothetical protein
VDVIFKIWPLLAFIIVQSLAAVWWAASISKTVTRLEKDMEAQDGLGERIAKMEGKLDAILDALRDRKAAS